VLVVEAVGLINSTHPPSSSSATRSKSRMASSSPLSRRPLCREFSLPVG
jgi:hypothetical protein